MKNRKTKGPMSRHGNPPEIRAQDGVTEILLYDEIGFFGIGAEQFVRDIGNIDADEIRVRINSPGGSVFDGVSIFNAIKRHPANVTTHIDGLAASIASVIAMAGDRVVMSENGFLMIHDPWSIVIGNAEDMRREAGLLDKVSDGSIVRAYTDKSGMSADEARMLMKDETWFTSEEALDAGLVDEVSESANIEASFNLSIFSKVPDGLRDASNLGPTVAERALRDAGFSRNAAKKMLASGYTEEVAALCDADDGNTALRDAGPVERQVAERLAQKYSDAAAEYRIRNTMRNLKS